MTVRHLLSQEPGAALCDSCLAFACDMSLTEMRLITDALVRENGEFQRGSTCRSCRRTVPTTLYDPDSSGASEKCIHCSRQFLAGEIGVMFEAQRFHDSCLRRVLTDKTIRLSRALSRQSRELIEKSRRQLSGSPLASDAGTGPVS
jgi:hypothetical protein